MMDYGKSKKKQLIDIEKKYQAFFSSVSQEKYDFESFFPLFLDFVKESETYYKAMFITQTFDDSDPLFLQFKKDSYKLMGEKKSNPMTGNMYFNSMFLD